MLGAGTGIDEEAVVVEEVLVVPPAVERVEVVAAHDEAKFAVGVFLLQSRQCNNGVAGNGQVHLDVADFQAVVVVDGSLHHLQAVVVSEEGGAFFQWVLGRDNKPQFIDTFMLQHRVGNNQMPHMYGIEGAKKKSGALFFSG